MDRISRFFGAYKNSMIDTAFNAAATAGFKGVIAIEADHREQSERSNNPIALHIAPLMRT